MTMELGGRDSANDDEIINVAVTGATSIVTQTIEWKEHKEFLANGVRDLFLKEYQMDTNVTFKGEVLKVHRIILAVFLPTFKRSLDMASMNRSNNDNLYCDNPHELNLDSVADRPEDVRALIDFVYTGKMTVSENRLDHLSRLAEDLSFDGLAKALGECEQLKATCDKVDQQCASNGPKSTGEVKLEHNSNCNDDVVRDDADGDDNVDDDDEHGDNDDEGGGDDDEGEEGSDEEDDPEEDEEALDDDANDEFSDNGSEYRPTTDGEDDSNDVGNKVVRRAAKRANTTRKEQEALDRYCEHIFQSLRHGHQTQGPASSSKDRAASTSARSSSSSSSNNNKGSRKQAQLQKKLGSMTNNKTASKQKVIDDEIGALAKCGNCKKEFLNSRSLRRHLKSCGFPLQVACSYCDHMAETRGLLRRHQFEAHRREMAAERRARVNHIKCPEPLCTFACDDQLKLKLHNRRMHCADKKYKCNECEYAAIRQSELTNHVTMCHLKQRNFMCDHCGTLYASRSGLYSHVRAAHEGYKHYKCEYCGKEFNTSKCYSVHVQSKHNVGGEVEMHVCHMCGKSYNRRWNLQLHTRRVHKTSLESRVKVYAPRRKDSVDGNDQGQDVAERRDGTSSSSSQQASEHNTMSSASTASAVSHVHRPVDELLEAIGSTGMSDATSTWVDVNPSTMHQQNQFMSH